jgi:hypothetical protein
MNYGFYCVHYFDNNVLLPMLLHKELYPKHTNTCQTASKSQNLTKTKTTENTLRKRFSNHQKSIQDGDRWFQDADFSEVTHFIAGVLVIKTSTLKPNTSVKMLRDQSALTNLRRMRFSRPDGLSVKVSNDTCPHAMAVAVWCWIAIFSG